MQEIMYANSSLFFLVLLTHYYLGKQMHMRIYMHYLRWPLVFSFLSLLTSSRAISLLWSEWSPKLWLHHPHQAHWGRNSGGGGGLRQYSQEIMGYMLRYFVVIQFKLERDITGYPNVKSVSRGEHAYECMYWNEERETSYGTVICFID